MTPERKKILRAYGAEFVCTDPMDGSDGAILEARRLYAESPDEFFYPDQRNDANWRAHLRRHWSGDHRPVRRSGAASRGQRFFEADDE